MHVSGLFIYPVKSCRGITVREITLDALGPVGDRRFLIVDAAGKFLTQRSHPQMALIATALDHAELTLSHPRLGNLSVPLAPRRDDPPPPLVTVEVWSNSGLLAEDCGPHVADWLSTALGTPTRLVRIGPTFHRPLKPSKARPGDVVSFVDAYPLLVLTEASLADLNDRLAERGEDALPMNRFRPNIVIGGDALAPYAEDTWPRLRIGPADGPEGVILRAGGPCARCTITTTDQITGTRAKEPLRTLASYRRDPRDPTEVIFGQNFIHETKSGTLHLGAAVTIA